MEAARLVSVPDVITRGTNALPSAGSSGKIPGGTAGPGPSPTPAKNSGTELSPTFLAASSTVTNVWGRQHQETDDAQVKGAVTDSQGGDFDPSGAAQDFQSSVK